MRLLSEPAMGRTASQLKKSKGTERTKRRQPARRRVSATSCKSTPCRPQLVASHACNSSEGTQVAADHELQTNKKLKKVRLLKKNERKEVKSSVSEEEVLTYVMNTVPPKLVSSLFTDRQEFWDSLLSERLNAIVQVAVAKFKELYDECGTGSNKSSRLFIRWLDYERSQVCLEAGCLYPESSESEDSKRTVITLILSTVYDGILKQMALELEKISQPTLDPEVTAPVQPSDETALHRICGWALKSVTDNVSKQCKSVSGEVSDSLRLLKMLKLPNDQKEHLPESVKHLDRGGLTFMRFTLLPWMIAVEDRMVQHLNHLSYRRYGDKLFEVSNKLLKLLCM